VQQKRVGAASWSRSWCTLKIVEKICTNSNTKSFGAAPTQLVLLQVGFGVLQIGLGVLQIGLGAAPNIFSKSNKNKAFSAFQVDFFLKTNNFLKFFKIFIRIHSITIWRLLQKVQVNFFPHYTTIFSFFLQKQISSRCIT
jgi:hypothetical protein